MIAYKTYEAAPEEARPPGVLLNYPWQIEEANSSSEDRGFTVVTQEEYDQLLLSLDTLNQVSMQISAIKNAVLTPAISFGQEMVITFAAENIGLGITQAGMTTTVRAATANVVSALQTGSLYDAITAARAIPEESYDATFVTEARILLFINKIEDYLGIPRSLTI
jgi:hypothetical protein